MGAGWDCAAEGRANRAHIASRSALGRAVQQNQLNNNGEGDNSFDYFSMLFSPRLMKHSLLPCDRQTVDINELPEYTTADHQIRQCDANRHARHVIGLAGQRRGATREAGRLDQRTTKHKPIRRVGRLLYQPRTLEHDRRGIDFTTRCTNRHASKEWSGLRPSHAACTAGTNVEGARRGHALRRSSRRHT